MALHLVTAQKSLNFRQLSSFWMVVQGKTITRTCCLAWLWGGTQLHSSGSREEHKAEALPCSAKEMNHWTALLELLALNCLYRAITVRVCACVHTYMATLFSTSLSFLITTLWTGKSSYSPNCSITVGITSLYFDWGPIWFSGLGSIIWESTSRKKKNHFETMATVCLENCKIDLILPSQDLRLLTIDKYRTSLWAQEFDSPVVELLEALKYPSHEQLGSCYSGLGWLRTAAPGKLMVRSQGYLEIFKLAMQVCFPCISLEYTETNTLWIKRIRVKIKHTVENLFATQFLTPLPCISTV